MTEALGTSSVVINLDESDPKGRRAERLNPPAVALSEMSAAGRCSVRYVELLRRCLLVRLCRACS